MTRQYRGETFTSKATVLRWASLVYGIAVDELVGRRARSGSAMRGMKTRSQKRDRLCTKKN